VPEHDAQGRHHREKGRVRYFLWSDVLVPCINTIWFGFHSAGQENFKGGTSKQRGYVSPPFDLVDSEDELQADVVSLSSTTYWNVMNYLHWRNCCPILVLFGVQEGVFLGGKGGRCVRLTTYRHPVPLSRNLGTLTSWNPLGLSRPVMGLLYRYLYLYLGVQ